MSSITALKKNLLDSIKTVRASLAPDSLVDPKERIASMTNACEFYVKHQYELQQRMRLEEFQCASLSLFYLSIQAETYLEHSGLLSLHAKVRNRFYTFITTMRNAAKAHVERYHDKTNMEFKLSQMWLDALSPDCYVIRDPLYESHGPKRAPNNTSNKRPKLATRDSDEEDADDTSTIADPLTPADVEVEVDTQVVDAAAEVADGVQESASSPSQEPSETMEEVAPALEVLKEYLDSEIVQPVPLAMETF